MKQYKIIFSGFAYVEAEDEEEAKDNFWDDLDEYRDVGIDHIEEIE